MSDATRRSPGAGVAPPPSVAKLGITSIRDDLPPGMQVNLAGAFVRIFRSDLAAAFLNLKPERETTS